MATSRGEEEDAFVEGFHDIPSAEQLSDMSFVQLAAELSTCRPGTTKYLVVENALLRHKDSAQTKATKFGVLVGAVAAIAGAVVGAVLTAFLSSQQPQAIVQCRCGSPGQSDQRSAVKDQKLLPQSPAKMESVPRQTPQRSNAQHSKDKSNGPP
ncbi:MAG: hypothetical protein JSS26_01980 [Nitrospira sp.]|nr:hypothetical protein [Nitrospira sp.]